MEEIAGNGNGAGSVGKPELKRSMGVWMATEHVASREGGRVTIGHDVEEAVYEADAVYADVWVSMGEEGERERRLAKLANYQVTPELMQAASERAVFMHCLPAHRGQEVAAEVIDGPRSVVFQQAENRLPTEQAVLQSLIGGGAP